MQLEDCSEDGSTACPITGCTKTYKNSQVIELAPEMGSVCSCLTLRTAI